jgi:succinate dehydrogenase/fumarate reductase flavoprotein subunit
MILTVTAKNGKGIVTTSTLKEAQELTRTRDKIEELEERIEQIMKFHGEQVERLQLELKDAKNAGARYSAMYSEALEEISALGSTCAGLKAKVKEHSPFTLRLTVYKEIKR